jgi:subtilisin family serine protease
MKRKYNVISKKGVDVSEIDADLMSKTEIDSVPDREVSISSPLKNSKRVTTFLLTDDEAEALKNDTRVEAVQLDFSERDDIFASHTQTSDHTFTRTLESDSNFGNWGLKRHLEENLQNYNDDGTLTSGNESLEFNLSGEGVDIVIMDSGVDASHPDFNDENGLSRVQQINWWDVFLEANDGVLDSYYDKPTFALAHEPQYYYRDYDGHGTSCASIAAGKRFGMAKKAHIYFARANIGFLSWNMTFTDWFDTLIYWHNNKGNNRPTILSNSWGFIGRENLYSEVTGGRFRLNPDDEYTIWSNNSFSDEFIANYAQMRINPLNATEESTYGYLPALLSIGLRQDYALDAMIEELHDAGVHIFNAAGNYGHRIVSKDHHEYDNFANVTYPTSYTSGTTSTASREYYYNRAGSPYFKDAFHVGAMDIDMHGSGSDKQDQTIFYSERGSAVDIYAATVCASAQSTWTYNRVSTFDYPDDSNYKSYIFTGTSCATPNVAGVAACYLSANPNLTPLQLKTKMLDDAKTDLLHEAGTNWNDYNAFLDSNNKILYNRYNQNVGITATNVRIENATFGTFKHETIANTRSYFELNEVGVNALRPQGYNKGSFDNEDVPNIYKNGKLLSLYTQSFSNNFYTYTLKFDGDVYNGGWEWIELTRSTGFRSFDQDVLRLKRKDAKWDHVKKEFSWTVSKELRDKAPLFGQQKLVIN